MPRSHTETIVVHGSRIEADGVFSGRRLTLSNSVRNALYALVISSPNIQDTVGNNVQGDAFSQNVHGSDDAYTHTASQQYQQPAHDMLPADQQAPVGALEQMFESPSVESPYDPYQTESYMTAQPVPEQLAQPELETMPGAVPIPTAELEQMTGMNQYDQLQVETGVAQDFPSYNVPSERAAVVVRLPGANDETMAAEARRIIHEVHGDEFHGIGYQDYSQIPGALQEL